MEVGRLNLPAVNGHWSVNLTCLFRGKTPFLNARRRHFLPIKRCDEIAGAEDEEASGGARDRREVSVIPVPLYEKNSLWEFVKVPADGLNPSPLCNRRHRYII